MQLRFRAFLVVEFAGLVFQEKLFLANFDKIFAMQVVPTQAQTDEIFRQRPDEKPTMSLALEMLLMVMIELKRPRRKA